LSEQNTISLGAGLDYFSTLLKNHNHPAYLNEAKLNDPET